MTAQSANQITTQKPEPWYSSGVWPYLFIAAACLILYSRTFWYGFSPMDEYWLIIAEKKQLADLSGWSGYFHTSVLGMYYRPILSLSFLFDAQANGIDPFCFHVTNVMLHLACSLLIFRFFTLFSVPRTAALFAALIFAVHPVNAHAVAWIPGRNDMLLTFFLLLSVISLMRFLRHSHWGWYILHLFFFSCTLFTKESAIVLPLLYLLIVFFFSSERKWPRILFFIGVWSAFAIAWFFLRKSIVDTLPPISGSTEIMSSFFSGMIMQSGKIFLPVQQSLLPLPVHTLLWPFLLVLAAVLFLVFRFGLRDKKTALTGLVWFGVLLSLSVWYGATNGIGEHYEHRIYTPLAGLLLFLLQVKIPVPAVALRRFAFILILVFAAKTFFRLPVYESTFSYAQAGTAEAPSYANFHDFLGTMYHERNENLLALQSFDRAIRLDSGNADYFSHRGAVHASLGNYQNAVDDETRALKRDPALKGSYLNRGIALQKLGRMAEAKSDLLQAQRMGAEIPYECIRLLSDTLIRLP